MDSSGSIDPSQFEACDELDLAALDRLLDLNQLINTQATFGPYQFLDPPYPSFPQIQLEGCGTPQPSNTHYSSSIQTPSSVCASSPQSPYSVPSVGPSGTTGSGKRKRESVDLDQSRCVAIRDAKGAAADAFMVFGTAKPKRSAYGDQQKKAVAFTRSKGACARCKGKKASCGRPSEKYRMCNGCTSVANPLALRLPCFLETLTGAQLFRIKANVNHPLYFPRENVYDLEDSSSLLRDMERICLAQGMGEEFLVDIARYSPQAGDRTALVWTTTDGSTENVELPPYCIVNLQDAKARMVDYIQRSRNAYINGLLHSDEMTFMVLDEARRFAEFNPDSTAKKALDLLAADRIIEKDWLVCGDEPCGIPPVRDPENPQYVKRPVTPMMDCQLDQLVIQNYLQPLRKELLEQLQTNINTSRQASWYDLFLTTFVLLANAELLLAHSRRNAIRHGAKGRYNSPELAALYFHACKMFISHFHFVCNFKGLVSIDWRSADAMAMARLDCEQTNFLRRLQNIVQKNSRSMLDLRSGYEFEKPSYWTHQIMFDGWSAGDPKTEHEYINKAPMTCA